MTEPTGAVFISYASEDADAARRICETLRAAGLEVWFDQSELRGGDTWDRQIRQQIHDCRLFIAVISAHTEARDEGYFRREWRLAIERAGDMAEKKAFLIPVVIDRTTERNASVPDKIREVQWSRAPDGKASPQFIDRISQLLSVAEPKTSGTGRSDLSTSGGAVDAPRSSKTHGPRRRFWIIAGGLALAVAVAAILWLNSTFLKDLNLASRQQAAALTSAPEKSIAVLPFVDLSEKHDQEYFGDGLADELLDLLAKVPGLRAIARTSSFRFKGKSEDLRAIGNKLGASYILEGSIRRSGDQIRVTAQLIRAIDDAHVWSESYDRQVGEMLQMQREIAAGISRVLEVTVEGDSGSSKSVGPAAHELLLRGLQAYERTDKAGFEDAANYFQQALDLEPSYTEAAEALALTRLLEADNGMASTAEGWERARKGAEHLLALDHRSIAGHAILARIYTDYDWDWERASREATEALALDSHSGIAHYAVAALASSLGQWTNAESHFRAALSVDPLNPDTHQALGNALFGARRYSEAAAEYRRAIEIDPTFPYGHYELGWALLALGQPDAALKEMERESPETGQLTGLACVYYQLGHKAQSDATIAKLTREAGNDTPYEIAVAHACRGEMAEAYEWLELAYQKKDFETSYIKGEWAFIPIKEDPRYKAFLRKMNLPE